MQLVRSESPYLTSVQKVPYENSECELSIGIHTYLNKVSHLVLVGHQVEAADEGEFVGARPRDGQPVSLAHLAVVSPVAF